jgi:hypothetical protein
LVKNKLWGAKVRRRGQVGRTVASGLKDNSSLQFLKKCVEADMELLTKKVNNDNLDFTFKLQVNIVNN